MNKYLLYIKNKMSSICLCLKCLILISFISLINTSLTVFFSFAQSDPSDVAIRSVMSSIFGFIFGSQFSDNKNINDKTIQIIIASIVSLICLTVSILSHWLHMPQETPAAVEIRNLLFASVGFLLSKSKKL
ncbi:MAG: hypothetical protein ACERKV_02965 [Clostridiaceae bacterium]